MHRIQELKDQLIEDARRMYRENADVREMGMVVDMVKDLCEAEKECIESCYYSSVIDSMDEGNRMGYTDTKTRDYQPETQRMGYSMYKNQYGTFRGKNRARRYGYSGIEDLREMMDGADQSQREQLKRDMERLINEM